LVGREYWSRTVPVWPALEALGRERRMRVAVHLVETTDQAAELILG
jgi:hypothetical protein